MKIVFLTGYSGSGKSTALRYVEEHGYYCVDNLPADLLENFINIVKKRDIARVAVVIDARGRGFMADLEAQIARLEKNNEVRVVFFESDLETITKRFQEHRLRHPLALKGTIRQGFEIEKQLLATLRQKAELVIDTSSLNVHTLKNLIRKHILGEKGAALEVHLMSFGFKYGIPQEADVVLDVRMLINPFFEPRLKKKTGKSASVQNYILEGSETKAFLNQTRRYVEYLLKLYQEKSKPYVTISLGCTGGKHRSVFVAEWLKMVLQERYKAVKVIHRDVLLG